jgi:hypothetical protein
VIPDWLLWFATGPLYRLPIQKQAAAWQNS